MVTVEAPELVLARHRLFASCSAWIGRPLRLAAWAVMKSAVKRLHQDLFDIVEELERSGDEIWDGYADLLVVAEDHRFYLHQGVDVVAICRAAVQSMFGPRLQGGSTIEQQLVRRLTKNREISLRRKLREVLLACTLAGRFSKSEVLLAYLQVGYFGDGVDGIRRAVQLIRVPDTVEEIAPAYRVAHLLYPSAKNEPESWTARRMCRALHIAARLRRAQRPERKLLLPTSRSR